MACMHAWVRVCVCVGALDENRESSRLGYKARIFCKLQTPVCDLVCSYLTTHTSALLHILEVRRGDGGNWVRATKWVMLHHSVNGLN